MTDLERSIRKFEEFQALSKILDLAKFYQSRILITEDKVLRNKYKQRYWEYSRRYTEMVVSGEVL